MTRAVGRPLLVVTLLTAAAVVAASRAQLPWLYVTLCVALAVELAAGTGHAFVATGRGARGVAIGVAVLITLGALVGGPLVRLSSSGTGHVLSTVPGPVPDDMVLSGDQVLTTAGTSLRTYRADDAGLVDSYSSALGPSDAGVSFSSSGDVVMYGSLDRFPWQGVDVVQPGHGHTVIEGPDAVDALQDGVVVIPTNCRSNRGPCTFEGRRLGSTTALWRRTGWPVARRTGSDIAGTGGDAARGKVVGTDAAIYLTDPTSAGIPTRLALIDPATGAVRYSTTVTPNGDARTQLVALANGDSTLLVDPGNPGLIVDPVQPTLTQVTAGRVRWRATVTADCASVVQVVGAYATCGDELDAEPPLDVWGLGTGHHVSLGRSGAPSGVSITPGPQVAVQVADGRVTALDESDGRAAWSRSTSDSRPLVVNENGAVVLVDSSARMARNPLRTRSQLYWMQDVTVFDAATGRFCGSSVVNARGGADDLTLPGRVRGWGPGTTLIADGHTLTLVGCAR